MTTTATFSGMDPNGRNSSRCAGTRGPLGPKGRWVLGSRGMHARIGSKAVLGRGAGRGLRLAGVVGVRFLLASPGRVGRRRGRPHPPGWAAGASRGRAVPGRGWCGSCRDPPGPLGAAPPPNKEGRRLPASPRIHGAGAGGTAPLHPPAFPPSPRPPRPSAPRSRRGLGGVGRGWAGSIVCAARPPLPAPLCPAGPFGPRAAGARGRARPFPGAAAPLPRATRG